MAIADRDHAGADIGARSRQCGAPPSAAAGLASVLAAAFTASREIVVAIRVVEFEVEIDVGNCIQL